MDRKRLVARCWQVARAAREMRAALEHTTGDVTQQAERKYIQHELAATGSGSWIDWGALLPVLTAIEHAGEDLCAWLPPGRVGPWQDYAYKDLVARLALTYQDWTGNWPRMSRDRAAPERDAARSWDYVGPFANILATLIPFLNTLGRLRGGLGDVAARHLTWVRQIDERQRAGLPIAPLLVQRKSRS
jgi:hypothetical protein